MQFLFIGISFFALLISGFGIKDIYDVVLSIILSYSFYSSIKEKRWFDIVVVVILSIIAILQPNYTHLLGFLAVLSCTNHKFKVFCLGILGLWIFQNIGFETWNWWFILLFLLLSLWGNKIYSKFQNYLYILCVLIICLTECINYNSKTDYIVESYPLAKESYKPDKVFSFISECIISSELSEKDFVVRSYAVGSKIDYEKKGVCILEHSPNNLNDIIEGGKWQQPISWNDNLFVGNQYLVESIVSDGGLWSNIGTRLKDTCEVLLAFNSIRYGYQPLIVKDKNTIYLHDSDYTSDRLANYQSSLIKEIFYPKGLGRPLYLRFLNFIFLVFSLFCLYCPQKKFTVVSKILLCVMFIYALYGYVNEKYYKKGDIRLVGSIKDSHENNRFDGVVKSIIDKDFPYLVGSKDCKILVVQKNHRASWNGETLVVLEPNAVLDFEGIVYSSKTIPLPSYQYHGTQILDPRQISNEGNSLDPVLDLKTKAGKEIVLISTGSPALIDWNQFLN